MPCQEDRVGDHDVVADDGVVGDVRARHEEAVGADHRAVALVHGAVDGRVLVDDRARPDRGARHDRGVKAEHLRIARDDGIRVDDDPLAQDGARPDDGPGMDDAALAELCARLNDGGGVDR